MHWCARPPELVYWNVGSELVSMATLWQPFDRGFPGPVFPVLSMFNPFAEEICQGWAKVYNSYDIGLEAVRRRWIGIYVFKTHFRRIQECDQDRALRKYIQKRWEKKKRFANKHEVLTYVDDLLRNQAEHIIGFIKVSKQISLEQALKIDPDHAEWPDHTQAAWIISDRISLHEHEYIRMNLEETPCLHRIVHKRWNFKLNEALNFHLALREQRSHAQNEIDRLLRSEKFLHKQLAEAKESVAQNNDHVGDDDQEPDFVVLVGSNPHIYSFTLGCSRFLTTNVRLPNDLRHQWIGLCAGGMNPEYDDPKVLQQYCDDTFTDMTLVGPTDALLRSYAVSVMKSQSRCIIGFGMFKASSKLECEYQWVGEAHMRLNEHEYLQMNLAQPTARLGLHTLQTPMIKNRLWKAFRFLQNRGKRNQMAHDILVSAKRNEQKLQKDLCEAQKIIQDLRQMLDESKNNDVAAEDAVDDDNAMAIE